MSISPFHIAFPVHDLDQAKEFYGNLLQLTEGRSCEGKWQDYNFFGNQIVCHYVGEEYRGRDYMNPVDGDDSVPQQSRSKTDDFEIISTHSSPD